MVISVGHLNFEGVTRVTRLKRGRVVGIFPEGGIRDGAHSVLEGAPLKPGIAALAQISGAPVVPCVLIGSETWTRGFKGQNRFEVTLYGNL